MIEHMSEGQTKPTATPTGHTLTYVAGLVVLVSLFGAATALGIAGWDGNAILGLLTGIGGVAVPLVATVARLTDLKQATDAQTATLAKIDHQTNGVLAEKIAAGAEAAVRKVMNEPIGLAPVSTPPATDA